MFSEAFVCSQGKTASKEWSASEREVCLQKGDLPPKDGRSASEGGAGVLPPEGLPLPGTNI